jgi:predicted lipoprotein
MRKKWLVSAGCLLLAGIISLASCSKDKKGDDKTDSLDRKPMLTHYADNYVLPAYTAMSESLSSLSAKTDAFKTSPDEINLAALRNAWKEAYLTWQTVDLLEFGPAEDASLRMYINTYPVTPSKIEDNVTSGSYDLETFGNKDAQGFPALDYLLNGIGGNSSAILAKYTTDPNAAAYRKYLSDVLAKMQEKINGIKAGWLAYRNTFVEKTATDANGSLSKMTNAYVLYYERYLRSGKIGYPVGAMTGVSLPTHTEAYYTPELSKELAVKALKSFIAFYEGKGYNGTQQGECMKTYLASIGTKDENGTLMADVVSASLNKALASLEGLNTTIRDGVDNNRPAVLNIYQDMQMAVALLKVDMVSAFGISITYVDNDGD